MSTAKKTSAPTEKTSAPTEKTPAADEAGPSHRGASANLSKEDTEAIAEAIIQRLSNTEHRSHDAATTEGIP